MTHSVRQAPEQSTARQDSRPPAWPPTVMAAYSPALRTGAPLDVRDGTGVIMSFDVARWLREPDAADLTLLDRCVGPTLDVGCGPGRLVCALTARGVPALGLDVTAAAVAIARSRGAPVLTRSAFSHLPGAGLWSAALLADGNVGIGGDVVKLLRRVRELLVLASFPWARIGARALTVIAESCGYTLDERWDLGGRQFVSLRRHQLPLTASAKTEDVSPRGAGVGNLATGPTGRARSRPAIAGGAARDAPRGVESAPHV